MQYLSLYLDHAKVGCGWRSYLVLSTGRRWAVLICTENAERLKVQVSQIAHGRPLPLKPTRAARRLRAVAATYGMQDSETVKDALAQLRAKRSA